MIIQACTFKVTQVNSAFVRLYVTFASPDINNNPVGLSAGTGSCSTRYQGTDCRTNVQAACIYHALFYAFSIWKAVYRVYMCRAALNAVVITETKLKQNKRKTMFCFKEIVLFQFYFRCNHCLSRSYQITLLTSGFLNSEVSRISIINVFKFS